MFISLSKTQQHEISQIVMHAEFTFLENTHHTKKIYLPYKYELIYLPYQFLSNKEATNKTNKR